MGIGIRFQDIGFSGAVFPTFRLPTKMGFITRVFGLGYKSPVRFFYIIKTKNAHHSMSVFGFGDPDENRTRVTAVKGRCLNRLTTGPYTVRTFNLRRTFVGSGSRT